MGTGQRQNLRVQAPASSAHAGVAIQPGAAFYELKWKKFVHETGLDGVMLHYYYLGLACVNPKAVDYDKLSRELFADMVAVGAIALPSQYTVDDFEFEMWSERGEDCM